MNNNKTYSITIVLPAKNEAENLEILLPKIRKLHPDYPIIVVNDGSSDNTEQVAIENDVITVSNPYSLGNGAAIKTGSKIADTDYILFMDADGQHSPNDIAALVDKLKEGYSMVVGARVGNSHANIFRRVANFIYNKLASKITGFPVQDLTSGFRIVDRYLFNRFHYLLPNKFSYPTTITMALIRNGHPIAYVPIKAMSRLGKSHINPIKDGLRFLIIILKIGSLYSPLKFFTPPSAMLFLLGIANYIYTFVTNGTFTNMSALLIISSIIVFMFGLLAEQLTVLIFSASQRRERDDTRS